MKPTKICHRACPLPHRRTPFSGTISAKRKVAFGQADLAEVIAIKRAFGTTVNDVVLACCTQSLREYLIEKINYPIAS